MPRTKTATKELRKNVRRRAQNLERQTDLRETVKKFRKLIQDRKFEEAKVYLATVSKTVDKLAKVGYIKRGRAARIKSRFAKKLGKK